MATAAPNPPERGSRPPDLPEVFIILLISAAVIIFIFWISTQFVGNDRFQNLPGWLVAVFKNVWAAVGTGATGIGLALRKAFTSRNQPQPHYLKYVGLCVLCVFVPVAVLVAISSPPAPQPAPAPPNTAIIDLKKTDKTDFDIETPDPNIQLRYAFKGWFLLRNGELTGHLSSGKVDVPQSWPANAPKTLTRISFRACYNDPTAPQVFRNIFPAVPKSRDSIDVDLDMTPGAHLALPQGDFAFSLPDPKHVSVAWICAAIWNDGGGYFPAE